MSWNASINTLCYISYQYIKANGTKMSKRFNLNNIVFFPLLDPDEFVGSGGFWALIAILILLLLVLCYFSYKYYKKRKMKQDTAFASQSKLADIEAPPKKNTKEEVSKSIVAQPPHDEKNRRPSVHAKKMPPIAEASSRLSDAHSVSSGEDSTENILGVTGKDEDTAVTKDALSIVSEVSDRVGRLTTATIEEKPNENESIESVSISANDRAGIIQEANQESSSLGKAIGVAALNEEIAQDKALEDPISKPEEDKITSNIKTAAEVHAVAESLGEDNDNSKQDLELNNLGSQLGGSNNELNKTQDTQSRAEENKDSEDKTSVAEVKDSTLVEKTQEVANIEDKKERSESKSDSIVEKTSNIEEEISNAREEKSGIEEEKFAKEKISNMEEKESIAEDKLSIAEEKTSAAEEKTSEKTSIAEEKISNMEEKVSIAEDKLSIAEEKTNAAEEKISTAEEKISIATEKTDDEQHKTIDAEEKMSTTEEKNENVADKLTNEDRKSSSGSTK